MLKEYLKDHVYDVVVKSQGCKATEIVPHLSLEALQALETNDISTIIAELINERKLIEVEYELPEMNWRTKSFLLPFKTEVRVNRCESEIESEFYEHLQQWKKETRFQSSSTILFDNEHYQHIIDMGFDVVPVILEYIRDTPDHFSYALKMITGEDPCLSENAGKVKENCESWVQWGIENNLIER